MAGSDTRRVIVIIIIIIVDYREIRLIIRCTFTVTTMSLLGARRESF